MKEEMVRVFLVKPDLCVLAQLSFEFRAVIQVYAPTPGTF
jgi:hypothetical protein